MRREAGSFATEASHAVEAGRPGRADAGAPRRRGPRLALVSAAVLFALAGCGSPHKVQEIVFWQSWPDALMAPLIEKFESEHPEIRVHTEMLGAQEGAERVDSALASGDLPDLCELGSTWMPHLLNTNALADWSAGVADLRHELRGWQLCSIGDACYGVPWVVGTRALFYNKTLFARAGLDSTSPPVTWADLYAAAQAIQKLGGGVHGYGVQGAEPQVLFKKFMPFAWGNGGHILSDDLSRSVFDSPRNVEALEFYLGLRRVGLLADQDSLDNEFKRGRLGLEIAGAWLFRSIARDAPDLAYGVALVPRPELERGTHASFAGGEVLASFNASKYKKPALELARFLVRPENALALAEAAKSVEPATIGADTAAYYRRHPNEAVMIRQFETAVPTPIHPAWLQMEAAIEDEVEQALADQKTAAEAVADADRRIAVLAKEK